jgi:pimeloyl-ACP methyl ester carboxylesterase
VTGRQLGLLLLGALPLGAAAALGRLGWRYSELLLRQPVGAAPGYPIRTLAADGERVLLPRTDATERAGVWGLEWAGGFARVGRTLAATPTTLERELEPVLGSLAAGEPVRMTLFAHPRDPAVALGIPFEETTIPSELGPLPAWRIPGRRGTWAIMVHGWGSSRREALRLLPTLVELGLPALVIALRNDPGAPAAPDGLSRLGGTEWRDLEAAAAHAVAGGATGLVLVGYSLGGGIVCSFLRRSPLAPLVRAAILEAPVLDWRATLERIARRRRMPAPVAATARAVVRLRTGIRWSDLDQIADAAALRTPILLIHGDDDQTVPVEASDRLAAARPDLVTYRRLPGVPHAAAWNSDPERYGAWVREFLGRSLGPDGG